MNRLKGELEVQLGERPRKFRLGWNEVAILEQLLGESLQTRIKENNFGFDAVRSCMFVGLKKNNPDLTIDDVGELLGESGDIEMYMRTIVRSLKESMPKIFGAIVIPGEDPLSEAATLKATA
jgi:hypothetical protein